MLPWVVEVFNIVAWLTLCLLELIAGDDSSLSPSLLSSPEFVEIDDLD